MLCREMLNYLILHKDTSTVYQTVEYLLYQENQEIQMMNLHVTRYIVFLDFGRNNHLYSTKIYK